jgi:hypothetical protein
MIYEEQEAEEERAFSAFTIAMGKKLLERRTRYGCYGWRKRDISALVNHLHAEFQEFQEANGPEVLGELVDIANTALVLYDRLSVGMEKGELVILQKWAK